jgi:hypothetical protein
VAWDFRREKREEAEQLLARTAQQLRAAGFNVTTVAKEGDVVLPAETGQPT